MHTPTGSNTVEEIFKRYQSHPPATQQIVLDVVRSLLADLKSPVRARASFCLEAKEAELKSAAARFGDSVSGSSAPITGGSAGAGADAGVARTLFAPAVHESTDLTRHRLWSMLPHYTIHLSKREGVLTIACANPQERIAIFRVISNDRDDLTEDSGVEPFPLPQFKEEATMTVNGNAEQIDACVAVIQEMRQHFIILGEGFVKTPELGM